MDIPTYLVTPAASQESAKAVTANQDDGLKSVDTGLGEDSSKQIGPQDKQYDTPPDSYTDAVSPVSSVSSGKRVQLRTESLGTSPSAKRGLGKPISGFGAGVEMKPPPLFENTSAAGALLQLSKSQQIPVHPAPTINKGEMQQRTLPSIAELDLSRPSSMAPPANEARGHTHGNVQDFVMESTPARSRDPRDTNPYAFRADEIGLSHGLPGVGHLGKLLEPPGWKDGDEPIHPQQVEVLYNLARKIAREELEKLQNKKLQTLLNAGRKDLDDRDQKWDLGFAVDTLVMKERIGVYEAFKERQRDKVRLGGLGVPPSLPSLSQSIPQVASPANATYLSIQQNPFRANNNAYLGSNVVPNPEPVMRNQDFLANPPWRPSYTDYVDLESLEPGLLTETFQRLLARYHQEEDELTRIKGLVDNRYRGEVAEIRKRKGDNEYALRSFIASYGPAFSNGPISPAVRTPVNTQFNPTIAANFNPHSLQAGFGQAPLSFPRPPAYQQPAASAYGYNVGSGEDPLHPNYPLSRSFRGVPEPHYQGNGAQPPYPTTDGPANGGYTYEGYNSQGRTGYADEGRTSKGHINPGEAQVKTAELNTAFAQMIEMNTKQNQTMGDAGDSEGPAATIKKRAPKKPVEKQLSWYHNEVIAANPPTSKISQAAMQAGIEYSKTGVTAKKAAAQKPDAAKPPTYARGKRPVIDPAIGMRVSKEVAATLISKGARDSTGGRVEGLAKAVAALPAVVEDATSTKASGGPNQSVATGKTNSRFASKSGAWVSEIQGKGPLYASQSQKSDTALGTTIPDPVNASGHVRPKGSVVSLLDDEETVSDEISSVEAEDPKDTSFGERITTPMKGGSAKILTRSANKRKTTPPKSDGPSRVNKRARTNVDTTQTDGTCDDPQMSANEDVCSPMLKATQRRKRGRASTP